MSDDLKRMAAAAALAEIRPGMRLGLGTGSTARHLVDLVGARVREGLDVLCVPTSEATAAQARGLGIPLTTLEDTPELDLTIDGADEIGPGLSLIKGAGGALLREKIVAAASRRMVVIADAGKRVAALGRFPLSIEVNRFGLRATQIAVERVAARHRAEGPVELRLAPTGEPFVTDGGHLILDAFFGRISAPEALSTDLHEVPGVVEHGLFLKLCQRAYVAAADGVETIDA
ncbi:MAG: ribose 5-phosphate isomerase A [Devosia sp. 67-54]|uniref:ribose-5-phosphate isomerase RpiA n=1 Tax=unclassified Devosia TaxID=196773 RepID=UPI00095CED0F|nr:MULTISPECIES: ribose-5-phosphate isomerase RpiA [unclassified Devosia]MBN9305715.1 ribose-5-phosphate isomerase RpiA [Devosia sp.]OJX19273.1 MAG: ribose 5-phosphate isomerase A [Devosia sp. 67-54]